MNFDKDFIVRVLHASCGDSLKALVLNAVEPNLKINPILARMPAGELEKAFAEQRARDLDPLGRFKEDHAKKPQLKFENVDPVQEARNLAIASGKPIALPYDPPPPVSVVEAASEDLDDELEDEPEATEIGVAADDWLSYAEAAAERGCGYQNIALLAAKYGWERRKNPDNPRQLQIRRADLASVRKYKKRDDS